MNNHIILFGDKKKNIDYKNIVDVAKSLLLQYVIVVGDKEFMISEIEFYIRTENHDDKYTHSDKNQKLYGKWYFHRYPNGSYKGGTYKGLDITFGNEKTYFGVLIRSIYDIENNEIIEGPCRTVNKILELNKCVDVKEYMKNREDPLNARNTKNFYIKRKKEPFNKDIYTGQRIGLSDKYVVWKNIEYRFVINKDKIKKNKKNLRLI